MDSEEVKQKVEGYINIWSSLLRLQDWDYTVIVPKTDPGSIASNTYNPIYRKSKIVIRNPDLHPEDSSANSDLEYSTVHELLHLHLHNPNVKEDTMEWEAWECGIDRIAILLVNLKRGQNG